MSEVAKELSPDPFRLKGVRCRKTSSEGSCKLSSDSELFSLGALFSSGSTCTALSHSMPLWLIDLAVCFKILAESTFD
jgi:hypothetical protein